PQPSWSLRFHLTIKLIQALQQPKTIEEIQSTKFFSAKSFDDPHTKIDKIIIPHEHRLNAQVYIEKLVKPYTIVIDPVWKSPRSDGINGEITMNKNWNFNDQENDWEKEKIV